VWVIDTKRYKGKVQIVKPLFGDPTLRIAGRDQTNTSTALQKQVDLVTAALAHLDPDAPIHGCLCFVDSDLPLFGRPSINGFTIFGRKGLAKQLNATGTLPADRAAVLAAALAERFPMASATGPAREPPRIAVPQ